MAVHTNLVVQADGVSKDYGNTRVVDAVSFCIRSGECCGILGPNGAGKTTTLKMLVGHASFQAGSLRLFGLDMPERAQAVRARLGIVPQQDTLDPDFTVVENLHTYGSYFGLSHAALTTRIADLLQLTALTERSDCIVSQLSGGLRRRLSIARALINHPDLLILDEPTTGLDPQIRLSIWQLLRSLQSRGITLILTTHYMEEAERLCDRVIVMDRGRILADYPTPALLREHIEPHVLEVRGHERAAWHRQTVDAGIRYEELGETTLYYGENFQRLLQSLENWPGLHYLHRPANLEDVFFKLTGRELRGD